MSRSETPHGAPDGWRPTPLVLGSLVLHGCALALCLIYPHGWPWALVTVVADHLLLVACGLSPRSRALGANWTRLPATAGDAVAITFDDGPDPLVTPEVLRILAEHGARATFFCIGERASRHPELVRDCARAGHAIENHSNRHRLCFPLLGPRRLRGEIGAAQVLLAGMVGRAPRFFRAPAGIRSPLLDPLLQRLGLTLASWTRRGFDTVSTDAAAILSRLTRKLEAGDILLLHDGHGARTRGGRPVVLEVLPPLLARLSRSGLRTVTLTETLGSSATDAPRPLPGASGRDPAAFTAP